ncbi:MAG: glycosyltransferase [Verrucomicrobia subdivision 3 bacterium]|nr:glycosyltransferase [Limisphaerales bacterium]
MSENGQRTSRLSVIMPVYNALHFLKVTLPPLLEMRERGEILEVIVADDESTDDTAAFAAGMGARVLSNPNRGGPGAARNFAALQAIGEILWFVDADVIAHRDGAHIIENAFADETVHAVYGSYDDFPAARNFMSQYKNLAHRYYHQRGKREASTFWAGCGAVRKSAFLAIGGFDTKTYRRPSIEDIDLGYRLRAKGGRILLLRELEGTHLKHWTLQNAIITDIFCRAVPWSRLMVSRVGLTDDLNVSQGERLRAGFACLLLLSFFVPVMAPHLWWAPLAMLSLVALLNSALFAFFVRRKGIVFALMALLYHQVYYVYSAATFLWCLFEAKVPGGRLRTGPSRAR